MRLADVVIATPRGQRQSGGMISHSDSAGHRYKVDVAVLARALRHTSVPLVRKDEQGNMFAMAATPAARQALEADSQQPAAAGGVPTSAQPAAGSADAASGTAPGMEPQTGSQQQPGAREQAARLPETESERRNVQKRPDSWG